MIGGNKTLYIQTRSTSKNCIGEHEETWETIQSLVGFIDMISSDSKSTSYNTKLVEATDLFIADYEPIKAFIDIENPRNARAVVENRVYDITYIDDPMGMHKHLEIYLKYTGGVNNV